jgi:hypothetical protein
MLEEVTIEFDYFLGAEGEVTLTVEIGDGQMGGSSVRLDGTLIGKPGTITNRLIGAVNELAGKKMLVKTLVSDESDDTDWTSVTYKLTGGRPEVPFTARHKVSQSGNGVIYRTTFVLKKRSPEEL